MKGVEKRLNGIELWRNVVDRLKYNQPVLKIGLDVAVAVLQGVLIVLMVHHGFATWARHFIAVQGDPEIYIWFLSWWGWALHHGQNLVFTHLVTYPWGNNTLWDTGVPLIFIPLSLLIHARLLSLPLAYNIATFGGWWFSGLAAYWSFVHITRNRLGSALGSFLVLTSAYFTNQGRGHTDLMWVGFGFILFGVVHDFARDSRSSRWLVWRMATLALCLWFTNEEYFVTTQMMLAFGLLFRIRWGVRREGWLWMTVKPILRGYGLGLIASAVVILPFVWIQLHAPGQPYMPIVFADIFKINLANFVIPVHTWWHYGSSVKFTGNSLEQDGFLGVIFLVGFALLWRQARAPRERSLLAWMVWLTMLSLGAFVAIDQSRSTGIPTPSVVLFVLPIVHSIVDSRFMWGVFWGIGLFVAIRVADTHDILSRAAIVAWGFMVMMTWWPSQYPVLNLTANAWIVNAVKTRQIRHGATLLEFPYDIVINAKNSVLYTQLKSHFSYRLAEGYLSPETEVIHYFDPLVVDWTAMQDFGPRSHWGLYYARQLKHPRTTFSRFLSEVRPEYVVLTPMPHEAAMRRWLTRYLGQPSGSKGQTMWWTMRQGTLS